MDFKDKKVCLVLSCDRPYYIKRRESNYETYQWFQQNGFVVVFLFASVGQEESELCEFSNGTYMLTVPSIECYELLSHKMELAYRYFSTSGCAGILKIDDDIKIVNHDALSEAMVLNLDRTDYYGISVGHFRAPPSNALHVKKYTINLFKTLQVVNSDIVYAGGPFYWVSAKAIACIAKEGLEYVYEDVSVGHVVNRHPELVRVLDPSIHKAILRWEDGTES